MWPSNYHNTCTPNSLQLAQFGIFSFSVELFNCVLLLVGYQLWRRDGQMSQVHHICYCFANFLLEYFVFSHTAMTPATFSIKKSHLLLNSVTTHLCNNQVVFGDKHVFWVSSCQAIYASGSLSYLNGCHATLSNGLKLRLVLMKSVSTRLTSVVNMNS